ncbi:MAG: O-antigen ligase family protein [Chloroflexi bacterium]|nr:O-antigen ligase family protein [Chloroflexota bacterium]
MSHIVTRLSRTAPFRWLEPQHGKRRWLSLAIVLGVWGLAFILGRRPNLLFVMALGGLFGALLLLRWPKSGFFALVVAALAVRVEVGTGTDVALNPASMIVPVMLLIWVLNAVIEHDLHLVPSRTNKPLMSFLLLGLVSILISNVIWDPSVPRSDRFVVVQLAQWAIWAFSAGIYWLVGNRIESIVWLRRITVGYLIVAGAIGLLRVMPGGVDITYNYLTFAIERAPFWLLLTAMSAGQLLFNQQLSNRWRLFLVAAIGASLYYSLGIEQDRSSNWVGVFAALGILAWLRFPRLRWLSIAVIIFTLASGVLFNSIYEFAGGDAKWTESGASRGVLIGRVLELSMRNPITGIGPAAYRPYGLTRPLFYEGAYWIEPRINSHNNYVDLFSQVGVVGLALFFWFMAEVARLGWRLRKSYKDGFAGGYVNGILAAWVGTMIIMALADWFLPFVYNIGFPGFQASVLIWMMMGGLITLEQVARKQADQSQVV